MSSKVDSLLKRAATFERLALYGDRKSFLQALAQGLPNLVVPNDPNAPPGQGGVHRVDPNPPAPAPQPNPPKLPRVVVPAPGGGGQWVDPNELGPTEAPPPVDRDPTILMQKQLNAPAVREQEKAAPATGANVKFDPRVKAVQDFLNQQLTQGGPGQAVAPPIASDGRWGTETANMLRLWGKQNKLPLNLNQLFDMAQAKAEAANTIKQLQSGPNLR
jgi:hypothetical protein